MLNIFSDADDLSLLYSARNFSIKSIKTIVNN